MVDLPVFSGARKMHRRLHDVGEQAETPLCEMKTPVAPSNVEIRRANAPDVPVPEKYPMNAKYAW